MDQRSLLQQVEDQYRSAVEVVERTGLAVIVADGSEGVEPVAFSVGGAKQGLPDLIIYGLRPELAAKTINAAFEVVRANWPFPSKSKFPGVLTNLEIGVRDASRSDLLERVMTPTKLYNMRQNLVQTPILQVCWPDATGKMPYEPGCDSMTAQAQRIRSLRN